MNAAHQKERLSTPGLDRYNWVKSVVYISLRVNTETSYRRISTKRVPNCPVFEGLHFPAKTTAQRGGPRGGTSEPQKAHRERQWPVGQEGSCPAATEQHSYPFMNSLRSSSVQSSGPLRTHGVVVACVEHRESAFTAQSEFTSERVPSYAQTHKKDESGKYIVSISGTHKGGVLGVRNLPPKPLIFFPIDYNSKYKVRKI
ncbi:hypothetical protein TNCV_3478771 [Trichonephila clavipes]|nr:hypothetical protein TNCV_3478771 [Trichonephila clavipes]